MLLPFSKNPIWTVAATRGRVHKIVHHKDYAHYKWKFSMANNTSSKREIQFMSMRAIKEIMGSQFRIIKVQGCCDRTKVKSNIFKRGSDFPATSERASNYRSTDKPIKMDDGHSGELSIKKFSSSRASSRGLADRSPSSSLERRYANKTGVRQSLDIEESTRRSGSIGARDLSSAEDRQASFMSL
ncbi:hypothetical protein NC651_027028 [Populus alba x Populus x berolinensis]|nr:hypothetical protein NC651_027028 [Populus alba x Populus x berolinensis]